MACEIIAFTNIENLAIADLGLKLRHNEPNLLSEIFSKHKLANSIDLASALNEGIIQLYYNDRQINQLEELCSDSGNNCWLEELKIPELNEGVSAYWLINRQINTDYSLEFIAQSSQDFATVIRIDEQIVQSPCQLIRGQRLKIAIEKINSRLENANITIAYCQQLNSTIRPSQQTVMQEYSLHKGEHLADIDYTAEPLEIIRQLQVSSIVSNANYEAYFQDNVSSEWQSLQIGTKLLPGYKVRYRYTVSNVAKPTINIIYVLSNNSN